MKVILVGVRLLLAERITCGFVFTRTRLSVPRPIRMLVGVHCSGKAHRTVTSFVTGLKVADSPVGAGRSAPLQAGGV